MSKEYIWNLTDLANVKKNGYKVFSCFSCGGGSSMGYKRAGYEVIGNVEIDPAMNRLYKQNFHPKYSYEMGVQDFKLLRDLPDELFDVDILDGSPPCSTFSMNGRREKDWGKNKKFREGQAEQVLSDLFFEFLDIVELLHPKVVVAENVKGIIQGNAKSYCNEILRRFGVAGYDTQVFLLNAATMGVPQRRERVFFIARRRDLGLSPVRLEFHEKPILYGEFADTEYRPCGGLAAEVWKSRRKNDRRLADTRARIDHGRLVGYSTRYVHLDEVPLTLVAGYGSNLRFDVCGFPSDRDLKIMQTFPQDYDFMGQPVGYVCGMSVPPIMMEKVAKAVEVQMLNGYYSTAD